MFVCNNNKIKMHLFRLCYGPTPVFLNCAVCAKDLYFMLLELAVFLFTRITLNVES